MGQVPIFMNVQGRQVLVVGGTPAAAAKVRLLLPSAATLRVVAKMPSAGMREVCGRSGIDIATRPVGERDFEGACLAYVATDDAAEDARIAALADSRGIPVNVVDRPELCTFTTPAIVDRAPIIVAVGTGGAAPLLARRVRAAIDRLLPPRLGAVADLAERFRPTVKAAVADGVRRRRFWERFMDGAAARAALAGDESTARMQAVRLLNESADGDPGFVALVAVGPGDPDLLTLRAHRFLLAADVIVHSGAVNGGILDLARRDADVVVTGRDSHASVLERLAMLAGEGRAVVHVRPGASIADHDIDCLRDRGVAVLVAPGVGDDLSSCGIDPAQGAVLPRVWTARG